MTGITHDGYRHNQSSSFPRTHPYSNTRTTSSSHHQQSPSSPWNLNFLNCDVPDITKYDFPPTPTPSTRGKKHFVEDDREIDNDGNHVSPGRLKSLMETEIRHRNHMMERKRDIEQNNYPKVISFNADEDNVDDDITGFNDPPLQLNNLSLNEISLEETFGFEKDEEFDRIYNEADDHFNLEEERYRHIDHRPPRQCDTIYTQGHRRRDSDASNTFDESIGLNSYHAKNKATRESFRREVDDLCDANFHENDRMRENKVQSKAIPVTPKKGMEDQGLHSPTYIMDRRRSSKPATSTPVQSTSNSAHNIITPSQSMTSKSSQFTPPTSKSFEEISSRKQRHRSASRNNHRSRSQSTSHRRRSRSRSISKAPSHRSRGSKHDGDDYHSSLFRGAALIREQLLRSMASTDHMMGEADREFLEGMIEIGRHSQDGGSNISRVNSGLVKSPSALERNSNAAHEDEDNDGIDFDYSQGVHSVNIRNEAFDAITREQQHQQQLDDLIPLSKSQSHTSSALETESRRLDNLARIFAANSSTSSSVPSSDSPSNKENENEEGNETNYVPAVQETKQPSISPVLAHAHLNNESISKLPRTSSDSNMSNNYAKHYFQEDTRKNNASNPVAHGSMRNAFVIPPRNNPQGGKPENEALTHARSAGPLWRSLVGNHVRFPSQWDDVLGPSAPEIPNGRKWSKWYYVARHRVKGDKRLNSRESGVRSRRSGGRILLRMVIREMHTQEIRREVAIGCLHPNARGIRSGEPLATVEDVREVWMAVRWVMNADGEEPLLDLREERYDYEGVVDTFLTQKRDLDYDAMGSALGRRKAVNNENVRAVFGDQPPLTTVDFHEDELAEILKAHGGKKLAVLPALMLLKLFLF